VAVQSFGTLTISRGAAGSAICAWSAVPLSAGAGKQGSAFGGIGSREVGFTPATGESGGDDGVGDDVADDRGAADEVPEARTATPSLVVTHPVTKTVTSDIRTRSDQPTRLIATVWVTGRPPDQSFENASASSFSRSS
jgi:hypothetical protein